MACRSLRISGPQLISDYNGYLFLTQIQVQDKGNWIYEWKLYFLVIHYFLMLNCLIFVGLLAGAMASCPNPPPAARFTIDQYEGLWYEIAKYQTAGGAYFEKDCKCTKIDVTRKGGEIYAYQTCEKNGKLTGVNATLIPLDVPGKFVQKISLNRVGYWVIQLDQETAIEFDCSEVAGIRNYCIHIMSRHKTLSAERLKELSDYALGLGLNTASLPMTITDQVHCNFSEGEEALAKNLLRNE